MVGLKRAWDGDCSISDLFSHMAWSNQSALHRTAAHEGLGALVNLLFACSEQAKLFNLTQRILDKFHSQMTFEEKHSKSRRHDLSPTPVHRYKILQDRYRMVLAKISHGDMVM